MIQYNSSHELDRFLDVEIFGEQNDGYFIDVGAFDGVTNNNTLFFERYRNWEGICIEGNKCNAIKLGRNRKAIIIECVIDKSPNAIWVDFERYSGLVANFDRSRISEIYSLNVSEKPSPVSCKTLDSVLKNNGKLEIDLCFISAMGSELNILRSIDFKQTDISVIAVETGNMKSNFLFSLMVDWGYLLVKIIDTVEVYIKK